jgi:hypothetical protein
MCQQEHAKEKSQAKQAIQHYQTLAHAIEEDYRLRFEQY